MYKSGISIKTQTRRATTFKEGIININTFCDGFEFGFVTIKELGRSHYSMPLSKFISKIKEAVK